MKNEDFTNGLLAFIKSSPTPFHAVETMVEILEKNGFKRLNEADQWDVNSAANSSTQGERYYVTRNNSSIVAFQIMQPLVGSLVEQGIRMVGARWIFYNVINS